MLTPESRDLTIHLTDRAVRLARTTFVSEDYGGVRKLVELADHTPGATVWQAARKCLDLHATRHGPRDEAHALAVGQDIDEAIGRMIGDYVTTSVMFDSGRIKAVGMCAIEQAKLLLVEHDDPRIERVGLLIEGLTVAGDVYESDDDARRVFDEFMPSFMEDPGLSVGYLEELLTNYPLSPVGSYGVGLLSE
jgi:hypothetical protein